MAIPFKYLLAKSLPTGKYGRSAGMFTGHIGAVMRAASVLIDQLGPTILAQMGLPASELQRFTATVRLGAYLHDWGKANEHFQVMVRLKALSTCKSDKEKKSQQRFWKFWKDELKERQMFRHEVLSGILASQVPSFRAWLEQCPQADYQVALWAAMGHHLKLGGKKGRQTDEIAEPTPGSGVTLRIYTGHPHFTALLKMGTDSRYLSLPKTLPIVPEEEWKVGALEEAIDRLHEEFLDFEEDLDEETRRFVAAVKATVLTADIAGSALPNTQYRLEDWMKQALNLVLDGAEIQALIDQSLGQHSLREFQKQIAASATRITLVQAGCGTGKTVGAYAWGLKYAIGRKLFFGYPTTGTASQGFIDYAGGTPAEARLMHSRASIDLENVLFSNEAQREKNSDDNEDAERIDARLTAFDAWQAKLIVCTVDTVLGLIQNNRKPLYSWPALCQSAFVFDEVHAYDERLFGALLRFLKTFRGAPILLMSASFTEGQLGAIRQVVSELGESLTTIPGPQALEILPRYRIQQIKAPTDAWAQVEATLSRQQKVLWVTNTVGACVEIYDEAARRLKRFNVEPLIYHSRYRYADRVKKHQGVVKAFGLNGPVFAVTTQVCEMSLDLSAFLLVTAMAPAAALVQRLGRLNRKVLEEAGGNVRLAYGEICNALIYPWTEKYPYEEEIVSGEQLLALLPDLDISQENLATAAAQLSSSTPKAVSSNWLDGNWRSFPGPLRNAGHTLTVLLEQDLAEIRKAARRSGKHFSLEAQRWTVPITLPNHYRDWEREGVYLVAPTGAVEYCSQTGAKSCK